MAVTAKLQMVLMLATASVLSTPAAFALARDCSPEPVQADAAIRSRWPDLPAALQTALDGRDDVDTCARIALRLDSSGILLRVNLLDGRSAARAVARKEDVVPTLVALLTLPETGSAAPAPPASSAPVSAPAGIPGPAPAGPGAGSATVTIDATASVGPAEAHPRPAAAAPALTAASLPAAAKGDPFRLELSLATGGRIGDGYRGVAVGALTAFEIAGWILGLEGAAAQYERADNGPATSSLLLALVGGRRFWFRAPSTLSIDLTAGPALAVRGFGNRTAVRAQAGLPDNPMPPAEDDGPWARLVASAHMSFRSRSVVRPFAGVDGELALGTWAAAPAGAEPRLPAWTLGIVIGAAVGTP